LDPYFRDCYGFFWIFAGKKTIRLFFFALAGVLCFGVSGEVVGGVVERVKRGREAPICRETPRFLVLLPVL